MPLLLIIERIFLFAILLIVTYIDIRKQIIPNNLVGIILVSGIIFSFLGCISIYKAILGMLVGGGLMFVLALVPNTLGGGDIKLMFACGAFLGPVKILWAVVIGFVLASIISIVLLMFRLLNRKQYIPFGPFLSAGIIIAYMVIN